MKHRLLLLALAALCTTGSQAMGIISPGAPASGAIGPGYGRFRFRRDKIVKWNCVFRINNPDGVRPGKYRFEMLVPIGKLSDVEAALVKLAGKS